MNRCVYFKAGLCVLVAGVIAAGCVKAGTPRAAAKRMAAATIDALGSSGMAGQFRAWQEKSGAVSIEVTAHNLTPGRHGAHIHAGGSCADTGAAAGPHWDPNKTGKHGNPSDPSTLHHAADMPNIDADAKGNGGMRFTTANFTFSELIGKTIVVHQNPDNYTDSPANGGSGARIGCGVIAEVSGAR